VLVDTVALAATIGGSVVALAGVSVTAWGIYQQRESAKELSAAQHTHEQRLARGARLFDARAEVYEAMLAFLQVWIERVEATLPILKMAGDPGPPNAPSDEEWRDMHVRLLTFGSPEAAALYNELNEAVRLFFVQAAVIDHLAPDDVTSRESLQARREEVRVIYKKITRLVSDELASL
jgi:hypothetical protein